MAKFHDLGFQKIPDGSIRLTQTDNGEEYIIDMHPAQLRHIAEQLGLVAPNYQADELSKRLAEQLCVVYLAMADDCRHLSPKMEETFTRLDAYVDCLPAEVFPHHLWERREAKEKAQAQAQAARAIASKPVAEHSTERNRTQPNATKRNQTRY